MPAYFESGLTVGELPWHGLGVNFPKGSILTVEQAIEQSGLDWEVGKLPVVIPATPTYVVGDITYDIPANVQGKLATGGYVTYRKSDGNILGNVGERYTILQNRTSFEFFQPFLDSGECDIHTCGSLHGGTRVWILAKLNREPLEIAADDFVEKFLLLSNSHDGSVAVAVGFTPIRVVCANTEAMARRDKRSQLLRVKHTRNIHFTLDQVRKTMDAVNAEFEATAEQWRTLARCRINRNDLVNYVKVVLEVGEDEKVSTKKANIIDMILDNATTGPGNDGKTAWSAYNGFSQHVTHQRGYTQDSRLRSLWGGDSALLNKRALDVALQLAN